MGTINNNEQSTTSSLIELTTKVEALHKEKSELNQRLQERLKDIDKELWELQLQFNNFGNMYFSNLTTGKSSKAASPAKRKPFTEADLNYIRAEKAKSTTSKQIAEALGRSEASINVIWQKIKPKS